MNSHTDHSDAFMFVGSLIHSHSPTHLEIISRGILVVSGGKIIHFQKDFRDSDVEDIRKRYKVNSNDVHSLNSRQFIIPGFVDTHIHASQYPNVGLGYDLPLLDWLQKYTFPLEKKFQDETFAEKVYDAVVKRTLANGTTTASYFATVYNKSSMILANCIDKLGQRAFVGKVNMCKVTTSDYGESQEESVASTKAFVEYILNLKSPLIRPIITPRFALSCDMKFMKELAKIAADYNLPIQTHVSENLDEIKQVKKNFPNSKNYVGVYDEAGLINEKTILAHGIYLEPEEIETIKVKEANISHCPCSNILLQSGICPVSEYLKIGLKVSLGTDCSGGHTCSILESIRQALMTSIHAAFSKRGRKLTIEEVFYMATMGGAQAMGLQEVIGNFMVGKNFDAILVDLNDTSVLDLLDQYKLEELFQKFIYLGNDRVMKKVFVAGKVVKNI